MGIDWGIGDGWGSSIEASLPPGFLSSERRGVIIALGCFVEDEKGVFTGPLAFDEDVLLFNSGVETVRVVWHDLEACCESCSEKNTGVPGLSSPVAEGVPTMPIERLLSLILLVLPFITSRPPEIVHRPLPLGVRSRFELQASLRSSEESSTGSAIGEGVNS